MKLIRGEGDASAPDDAVNQVYVFTGIVREYYIVYLERNFIDNKAMNLIFNVHYGQKYMNAFWNGDGQIFASFSKSLDVTAHELTHGVTQNTANLDYYSQSGALNEHFSDGYGGLFAVQPRRYYLDSDESPED